MTAYEFFNLTREVRSLQKEYFKTRETETLRQAKQKEKQLDAEIDRVTALGY